MPKLAEDQAEQWSPFGVRDSDFDLAPERDGVRVVNVTPGGGQVKDAAGKWLRVAMIALGVLAAAAAAVSWQAQYNMVLDIKNRTWVAALEAGIPDAGAIVFAALGIALALHGKRAVRTRALNVLCVGISLMQNALAAGTGWRDLVIWIMPSAVYAVASDTLIGVIRAWAIARVRNLGETLADEGLTWLAIGGGVMLWLLRLTLAPKSTLAGFRSWVVTDCPVAPGLRPGHVAALEAVRKETSQLAALVTAERDKAIEQAAQEISQARDEATRAEAAEAAMRDELRHARSDAAQERDELHERMQRQAEELRAELAQVRDAADRRIAQALADAAGEREELRKEISQETGHLAAVVTAERDNAIKQAAQEISQARDEATRAEAAEAAMRAELAQVRDAADRRIAQVLADAAGEREELRAELGQLQDQKAGAEAAELEEARKDLQDVSGRLVAALKEVSQLRKGGQDGKRVRHAQDDEPTKRNRMIMLAGQRRDLKTIPLQEVAKLASAVASEIGYSQGTARRELMRHVREVQASEVQAITADPAASSEEGGEQ